MSTNNAEFLKQLAEGYTGNAKQAETIADEAALDPNPVEKTRILSVAYIQSRDSSLFETALVPQPDQAELDGIRDLETELRDLDYEERIVSLMKTYEQKTNAEIAETLGISEGYVSALLQQANIKVQQSRYVPPKAEESTEDKPKKKKKEKKHFELSLKTKIGLAALAVVVLGVFVAVRSYAHSQYEKGEAALNTGNYEDAAMYFKRAAQWGDGDKSLLKLADAYFLSGDDANAYIFYEDYHGKYTKDEYSAGQMVICLKKQADRYVMANDLQNAAEAIEKANGLQPSIYLDYRLKALRSGENYQSADGSVWNLYGQMIKAACLSDNGTVLYTVEVLYDGQGHWRKMTAGKSGTLRTSQYEDFLFEKGTVYDVRWIPGGDLPAAYAVSYQGEREDAQYETDSDGHIVSMVVEHDKAQDSAPFAAYTKTVFTLNENGEYTGAEIFDENERKIGTGVYVPENGWLYLYTVSR